MNISLKIIIWITTHSLLIYFNDAIALPALFIILIHLILFFGFFANILGRKDSPEHHTHISKDTHPTNQAKIEVEHHHGIISDDSKK